MHSYYDYCTIILLNCTWITKVFIATLRRFMYVWTYEWPLRTQEYASFALHQQFTIRAFSRGFYPKRLSTFNTHIDTPTAESFKHGGRGEFLNVEFSTSPTKGSGLLDKLNWAGLSFGEVKGIKMLTWDSGVELGAWLDSDGDKILPLLLVKLLLWCLRDLCGRGEFESCSIRTAGGGRGGKSSS
jgi:hypothetical protein